MSLNLVVHMFIYISKVKIYWKIFHHLFKMFSVINAILKFLRVYTSDYNCFTHGNIFLKYFPKMSKSLIIFPNVFLWTVFSIAELTLVLYLNSYNLITAIETKIF